MMSKSESSEIADIAMDHAAAMVGLSIPQELRQGVLENLKRAEIVARSLFDFPLPETIEIAGVFDPEKAQSSSKSG
jgi:hypothetical protein